MRAFIVAILLLVGSLFPASADVPVPQRKPVQSECPAGFVKMAVVWDFAEQVIRQEHAYNEAVVIGDKRARILAWAHAIVSKKEPIAMTEIIVFMFTSGNQIWIPVLNGCGSEPLVIDANTVKAMENVLKSTI